MSEIIKEIVCKTKKEEKEVLATLEKMGYMWAGRKNSPTECSFFEKYKNYALQIWSDMTITYGNANIADSKILITAKEVLQKNCIVIYQRGLETVALNKATGEKAVAKCCDTDVYKFNVGAKLALERLLEPKPLPVQYYNGKVVCIRVCGANLTKGKIIAL